MRWGRRRFVLALGLVALAAAGARAADQPYLIHVIQSQSGGAAFLGKSEGIGLRLYQQSINARGGIRGRPLEFVYHDDQTNPQVAVQLATEILAQHPAAVVVASIVASCNALTPLFQDAGPVMYCLSPGIRPRPGSYVYSTNTSTLDLATAAIRYFRLKGWTRIAILTSTDASGQDAARVLREVTGLAENATVKVVATETFNTTDVSVAAQIERIKAADPQLLVAWSTGAPIGTAFRAIAQAGLDVPVLTTDGNMTYAQMTQYAAFLPKRLYIQSSPWMVDDDPRVKLPAAALEQQKRFYAAFRAAGIEPDVAMVFGWEPGNLIASALQAIGPDASAKQLNDHLQHLQGFAGVTGIYDFEKTPQRGLDIGDAIVTLWDPALRRWEPVSQLGGVPIEK